MSSMDDFLSRGSLQTASPVKLLEFSLILKGLVILAKFFKIDVDLKKFEAWYKINGKELSQYQIIREASQQFGLFTEVVDCEISQLRESHFPSLIIKRNGEHFVVLKAEKNQMTIVKLSDLQTTKLTKEEFFELYEGQLLTVKKNEEGMQVNFSKNATNSHSKSTNNDTTASSNNKISQTPTPKAPAKNQVVTNTQTSTEVKTNESGATSVNVTSSPANIASPENKVAPVKNDLDYAVSALSTVVEHYGLRLNLTAIKRDLDPEDKGLSLEDILTIIERIRGTSEVIENFSSDHLIDMTFPAIVWQKNGQHLTVLAVNDDTITIQNYTSNAQENKTKAEFNSLIDGDLIKIKLPQIQKPPQQTPIQMQQQMQVAPTSISMGQIQQQAFQSVQSLKEERIDLALRGLVILAKYHGEAVNEADVKHQFDSEGLGISKRNWLRAAKSLELKAKLVRQPATRMHLAALPALAWREDGQHFIVAKVDDEKILIQDLASSRPMILTFDQFAEEFYEGELIVVASRASVLGSLAKFDFTWFIPAIIKYRRILLEVLLISIFIQLFALVTPLFFQVVMDKVLVHRAFTTLDVICIALLVINIFDVTLSGLRTFIFAHTTSRIDVELGARLFRHMLALPIAYFEARRVGETVARVRELEQIRNFLTGQALTSVLDLMFSFIFLIVMVYYSFWLTLVVVVSLPCYAFWSAFISPVLRARLNEKFMRNADNQSFLVESVTGVGTIKAMAVEPQTTTQWDKLLAAYVYASFRVTRLANIGQQGVQLIQKIVSLMTLWLGAQLVIKGEITVGQLIAFNMLSGQVSAPIVRLAQLWQDFQQVGISVARLGDILNTPTENPQSRLALPPIQGDIEFENIVFRYRPDGPEILRNLSLEIKAGEIIGIVGRSGSGKSTLTKLAQRMYVPERGRVLIDGNDLALADPAWLRRQIGVVLQENLLFNRTIKENIALSDPGMELERIIDAAKLAGAHEFIMDLPEGYDTMVGEQGSSLSGGQRQRIAIARALIGNPRILIFDEATSALDYESERAIMNNMRAICENRTVLIIAHRLSTVRMSSRIIVMEKGVIIESGSHDELLKNESGHYSYLYQLQNG